MQPAGASAGAGLYPERVPAREPAMDRLAGALGFRLQKLFLRRLPDPAALAAEVRRRAESLDREKLAAAVPGLRYRLRRDGWRFGHLAECLAHGVCALGTGPIGPQALGAAAALVRGAIVDAADPATRDQALLLAALANAVLGLPVHLLSASEARARRLGALLEAPARALGLGAACITQDLTPPQRRKAYAAPIVCAAQREVGFDFLRDRVRIGPRARALHGILERLAGDAPAGGELMLNGLHCALVEDAELALLDDAHAPLLISAESDASGERLLYEQSLELARALAEGSDFSLQEAGDEAGATLTPGGSQRLAQLSVLLGPVWSARQRREELASAALAALHLPKRERAGEAPAPAEELLKAMREVKEGAALSRRRDVLFRTSVPGFFSRYLQLAGVCADARGLEDEFWALYALKVRRAGAPQEPVPHDTRVFRTSAERREAAARSALGRSASGTQVVVAVRTAAEGQALRALLGAEPKLVQVNVHPAQRDVARAPDPARPLHLIVAEMHDARRHVGQIARAYGAASCELLVALEDKPVASRLGPRAASLVRSLAGPERLAGFVQRALERTAAAERRELVQRERQLDDLLAFSGRAG